MHRLTVWFVLGFASTLLAAQAPQPEPDQAQPADAKPAEPKPPEAKPEETPADTKTADAKPETTSPDQLLRYKFAPGGVQKFRVVTNQKQIQRVGDKTRETTIEREDLTTRTVIELDDKGFALARVQIEALRVNAVLDGQTYAFDSRTKSRTQGTAIGKALNPVFERLAAGEYRILIGPQGEVPEVRGYAELIRDLLMNNPLASQVIGGGHNNSARVAAEEQTVPFGNKVVQPGEKWSVPVDLESPGVGRARGQRVYTLVGPERMGDRELLRINIATDLVYDVLLEREDARVSGTLTTAESSGVAYFDKAAGALVSLKASWKLSGTLAATVKGLKTEIENEQANSVTVEARK